MKNDHSRISPKVIALVIFTVAITLAFFLLPLGQAEKDAPKTVEGGSGDEGEHSEVLFDDSEKEFENEFVDALTTEEETTTEFLKTDYEPLAKWLSGRFELQYSNMTPEIIFDQVPLNDIFYEVADLSDRKRPFKLSSTDISRRELLEEIASFWNLKMEFQVDESGTPTAVRVMPR